jgi:hypothetical protein
MPSSLRNAPPPPPPPPAAAPEAGLTVSKVIAGAGAAATKDGWLVFRPQVALVRHGRDAEGEDTVPTNGHDQPLDALLRQLNPALKGCCAYFRPGVSSAVFGYLSHYAWLRWADGWVATPPIRMEGSPPPLLR